MDEIPAVYCLVPVYNRLETTRRFLDYISRQDYPSVQVIVVDDGSTDGTGVYLSQVSNPNLIVLSGTGDLWWSGAMRLGMKYLMQIAQTKDYLLMLNDDVRVEPDYISTLVRESLANHGAVMGSSQCDETSGALLNSGWYIDYWAMSFSPVRDGEIGQPSAVVNALPGRGVLFPMSAVLRAGAVDAFFFPHYHSDFDYSVRVAELGWKIVVSKTACVYTSSRSSDLQIREMGFFSKYFSSRSKNNLVHRLLFFCFHGPFRLRILALLRYPVILIVDYVKSLIQNKLS